MKRKDNDFDDDLESTEEELKMKLKEYEELSRMLKSATSYPAGLKNISSMLNPNYEEIQGIISALSYTRTTKPSKKSAKETKKAERKASRIARRIERKKKEARLALPEYLLYWFKYHIYAMETYDEFYSRSFYACAISEDLERLGRLDDVRKVYEDVEIDSIDYDCLKDATLIMLKQLGYEEELTDEDNRDDEEILSFAQMMSYDLMTYVVRYAYMNHEETIDAYTILQAMIDIKNMSDEEKEKTDLHGLKKLNKENMTEIIEKYKKKCYDSLTSSIADRAYAEQSMDIIKQKIYRVDFTTDPKRKN